MISYSQIQKFEIDASQKQVLTSIFPILKITELSDYKNSFCIYNLMVFFNDIS